MGKLGKLRNPAPVAEITTKVNFENEERLYEAVSGEDSLLDMLEGKSEELFEGSGIDLNGAEISDEELEDKLNDLLDDVDPNVEVDYDDMGGGGIGDDFASNIDSEMQDIIDELADAEFILELIEDGRGALWKSMFNRLTNYKDVHDRFWDLQDRQQNLSPQEAQEFDIVSKLYKKTNGTKETFFKKMEWSDKHRRRWHILTRFMVKKFMVKTNASPIHMFIGALVLKEITTGIALYNALQE